MGLRHALLSQRGTLLLWLPICLGAGIGLYFALPREPSVAELWGLAALAGGLVVISAAMGEAARPIAWAVALVAFGCLWAALRAAWVAAPVLEGRYYGAIEGRVVAVDRSASGKPRLTLDRVVLERRGPDRTPARVRLSMHGADQPVPRPGARVILTGHLAPPGGPVEPGGYDFQRAAWFDRLGAVGYTRTPVLLIEPARDLWLDRLRAQISRTLQAAMPGETGAVAAAITVGDRSGLDPASVEALRVTNLAHLLAISGLHMGLLTGVVFGALRLGLAFWPHAALHWPTRKIAAGGALLAGAAYLALSGAAVATERAFIMAAVVLGAVLLDRRAITLRAVAVAATLVLLWRPEALTGPGFQMSFAATTALVAAFGVLRGEPWTRGRAFRIAGGLILSSLVAGLATAPFAAAHFNRIAHYGLVANLASVPVMSFVVMPAAVAAALLAPLGLAGPALWLMDRGLAWILAVAREIATWPGAQSHVPAPGPWVLPLLALGALWALAWQGRARWGGLVVAVAAGVMWAAAERPAALVAESGRLIGVATPKGRALSKPRGDGFAARVWLENDGTAATQEEAAARPGFETVVGLRGVPDLGIWIVEEPADLSPELCDAATLLVSADEIVGVPCPPLYDAPRLGRTGSLAVIAGRDGPRVVTAREVTGDRFWNTPELRRARYGHP